MRWSSTFINIVSLIKSSQNKRAFPEKKENSLFTAKSWGRGMCPQCPWFLGLSEYIQELATMKTYTVDSYYQDTLESSNLCWSFLIWFFIFPLYTIVHISNSNYGLNLFELLKTYAKLSKSQEHVQKKHFLKFWKHITL